MAQGPCIPIMLDMTGKRCVIVGGGGVAARRTRTLLESGADVTAIAPELAPQLLDMQIKTESRRFEPTDLDGAFLVVVATDQPDVNQAVHAAARDRGVLVNRTDDAGLADLTFMTAHRDGPLTLAVHTGGASAGAAVRIRDELAMHLDDDWAALLTHALPARKQLQQQITDPAKRLPLLRRLTDDAAMNTLKTGGQAALRALYADIIQG